MSCSEKDWAEFLALVDLITSRRVGYGPGRGLFQEGRWYVTHGPGGLGRKTWKRTLVRSYPSFHCSSWINFFLGWLLCYDDRFTEAGNVPSLFDLCEASDELHPIPGTKKAYRGYGPYCRPIPSDGSTARRLPDARRGLDIRELQDRRETLPTFIVCGQASRRRGDWSFHHSILFVVDHREQGAPMYRFAADGSRSEQGYSGTKMKWLRIDEAWVKRNAKKSIYRCYGLSSARGDGDFSQGATRPPVVVER